MKTQLSQALNEKDVENIYRKELLNMEGSTITSPFNVDGLLEAKNVRALLEFKYDENLKNKLSQSNVLIQCLYYLKKFEDNGQKLPSTIFVGDKNECFALHTNTIIKYLSSNIDWRIAPSEAHKRNPELVKAMVGDNDILPFIYDIDSNFRMKDIIGRIQEFSQNIQRKVRVTKHNIVAIFDYFDKNVLGKVELTTNEKANLFIQIVINPTENYPHPKKKNVLQTLSFGDLNINENQFKSFFKHFEGDVYSPKEKEGLTSLVDRLVDDSVRRNKGEFFTPTTFVDKAHEYLTDVYGTDWKERFVVWDNSSGTHNLTRDYKFKELYTSTLEQSDIDTANQMGYNPEATKFQYDFLNDSDDKLPQGLQDAINEGKEILFLINPPYATANNKDKKEGSHKGGISTTIVGQEMRNSKEWGASTQQLYSQFLYRIWKYQQTNKNIHIAIFCKPNYLSGGSFKNFRNKFFGSFGFEKGFLFQASHFSDVSTDWGINFAVFSNSANNVKEYVHDLVEVDNEVFNLSVKGEKYLYNVDGRKKASDWVREEVKGLKTIDAPQQSSTYVIKEKGRGNLVEGGIGYILSASNNIQYNSQSVAMFSSCFSNGNGLSIIKENILKTTALFTARKAIKGNWINDKDEYLAPNEEHPKYRQFELDSLVYSLFNNSSQQSSLRQVDYKGKKWDIKNEFFWMDKETMLGLAEENNYDALYQDARTDHSRYVNTLLSNGLYANLSDDAKEILDMATELTKKTFGLRQMYAENNPHLHLDSWDAGYAQLKGVWNEYYKEEFKAFRTAYTAFENRLRPLVFELGFLRK